MRATHPHDPEGTADSMVEHHDGTQRPLTAIAPDAILQPGRTCWRLESASRAAVLVDAADYFAALNVALEGARHSVFILGWDFNHRIRLRPGVKGAPSLWRYLNRLVRRSKGLRVQVLKWDTPMIFEIRRRTIPFFLLNWLTLPRLKFRLDSDHPLTGSQHQKIVVIDDSVAFCGGIDLTDGRWDRSAHRHSDEWRVGPGGEGYSPVHDMMMMVDGDAARALGDLARMRWQRATGKILRPPPPTVAPWPTLAEPQFKNVKIGIARTEPAWDGHEGAREIEALNLAALASARRLVYIENQHFASRVIFEAVRALLQRPDGPEIVVVNPGKCPGWVEQFVMGEARTQILAELRRADPFGRFRIYMPHCEDGTPIYVHSKCLIVDDHYLRVGSSNFNNRSMGFDKECDLALTASTPEDKPIRHSIAWLRDALLAEHLGMPPEELRAAVAACGSWVRAIDGARRTDGRSLSPIPQPPDPSAGPINDSILDPEHANRLPL